MRASKYAVFTHYGSKTVCFNTLTHSFLSVDMPLEEFKERLSHSKLPDAAVEVLSSHAMLVDDTSDEYSEFLTHYRDSRYGSQGIVLYITPTLKCNASCHYCFQRDVRPGRGKESGPSIESLLHFLAPKLPKTTGLKVTWFGGEPLLRTDYIQKATKALRTACDLVGRPYAATMVTSGLLLDSQAIHSLDECGIHHLQVSFDGSEEVHNAAGRRDAKRGYRDIVGNLRTLPDHFRVALRINVSRRNAPSILDLIDDLSSNGLARDNFAIDFPLVYNFSIDNPEADYRHHTDVIENSRFGDIQLRLLAYAGDKGFRIDPQSVLIPGGPLCHAVRTHGYSVWPDGSVTRCVNDVTSPEGINIADNPARITTAASQNVYLHKEHFADSWCKSCWYLPICGGSCLHGRISGLEPPRSCPPSKSTIPDRMRWFEAAMMGERIPLDRDRESLSASLLDLHASNPQ